MMLAVGAADRAVMRTIQSSKAKCLMTKILKMKRAMRMTAVKMERVSEAMTRFWDRFLTG